MFSPFFLDGPLRGRYEALPDNEFHNGHAYQVSVARGCEPLAPWTEPYTLRAAEKPWEADQRIYRYRFGQFSVCGRMAVLGWCAADLPSEAALFDILINPVVRSAMALQDEMTTLATGRSDKPTGEQASTGG